MSTMISTTILLLLIIDPLGNLPIFISLLKHLEAKRQRVIIIREMLIALLLMLLFLFSGKHILFFLNIRTEIVSISGGIILFFIAIKMIFPTEENNNDTLSISKEPFLVPLAIPLIAGPSILATLMLLSQKHLQKMYFLLASLLIAWFLSFIILMLSNTLLRLLGSKGVNILERLMGLLLIMISSQMFLDGIRFYLHSGL